MRHERVLDKNSYSKASVVEGLQASQLVPLPIVVVEEREAANGSTPCLAAPDVPASVGGMLFAAYAALIAAFAVATAGSAESIYAITISASFVVVFFTVPRIFFKVEPQAERRPTLERFMREGVQTLTGHCTGRDALIQMLIVPVFLTFAALAMGVAAAIYL